MQRYLRYLLEGVILATALGWLTLEVTRPIEAGFTPPESSWQWSWSDLVIRSSPSPEAHTIGQIDARESVQVIGRPDGWAAILDTVEHLVIGFIPDSALHPQQLPTFARAYSRVGAILDSLHTDPMWVNLERPSRLQHVSNGMFEAMGAFPAEGGEADGRNYRLLLQYADDTSWEPISLTIDNWGY